MHACVLDSGSAGYLVLDLLWTPAVISCYLMYSTVTGIITSNAGCGWVR